MGIHRYGTVGKADAGFEALRRLRLFLNREEPALVRLLCTMWSNQEGAITYKELRKALLSGSIDAQQIQAWEQDYSHFVNKRLRPCWEKAIHSALEAVKENVPEWNADLWTSIDTFTQERSGFFVTRCTDAQHEAINALIERAAVMQDATVTELSQVIRPLVGLTKQQAEVNLRLYKSLCENKRGHKGAMNQCIRLAERQHRYRALNIARTEMAWAYNKGEYEAVLHAQQDGYLGPMKKVWCTADDERVCVVCGKLEGQEFAMEESIDFPDRMLWEGFMLTAPAHCSCRCTVLYEEIAPPLGGGKGA